MRKILLLTMFFILSPQLHADEAELLNQISELKAELRSQHERIKRLEKLLLHSESNGSRPIVADKFAWQDLRNWNRVRSGMSRSQVESILGKPTKVEVSIIGYVTLYYQGEKSGAGYVSGNVELNNKDRVLGSGINKPVM
ncbi:hypothetical protein [Stutzerimonas stutzeri]|uniref:hypothetical protein n=1 Tax=Stutzerimonas stutzeri TaxID=316 RepID=UPI0032B55FDF